MFGWGKWHKQHSLELGVLFDEYVQPELDMLQIPYPKAAFMSRWIEELGKEPGSIVEWRDALRLASKLATAQQLPVLRRKPGAVDYLKINRHKGS